MLAEGLNLKIGRGLQTLQISLGYVRQIGGGPSISAQDKGRMYWRLRDAHSLLTKNEAAQTPSSIWDFLDDLKNTLVLFAAHKDLVKPANADPEGDVF